MTAGLRVKNSAGVIVMDTSMYYGRYLGKVVAAAGVDDSLVDLGFLTGNPVFATIPITNVAGKTHPIVTFVGSVMSWEWQAGGSMVNTLIIYGVGRP